MAKERSDLELIEAWREGDKVAGTVLIKRYFSTLNRFFANKVADNEKADLIQSTLLECTKSVTKYRGDAAFRTYLLSIARNVLLHHYRQRGRKQDKLDPLTHSVSQLTTGVFTKLARAHDKEIVLQALRQLPIDIQIALELKYWERLTTAECAAILGIPANTVSGRIRRGKEKLKQIFAETQSGKMPRPQGDSDMEMWMEEVREILGGDPRELLQSREELE